jgi:hypothetical protein
MDNHSGQPTADRQAGSPGVLRQLLDVNTFWDPERKSGGFRWIAARLGLFVVGTGIGSVLWGLVDPGSDRSLVERVVSNVYIWACLIATAVYAVLDRRARRRSAVND